MLLFIRNGLKLNALKQIKLNKFPFVLYAVFINMNL